LALKKNGLANISIKVWSSLILFIQAALSLLNTIV